MVNFILCMFYDENFLKSYLLYDFIYMTCGKRQNDRDGKQTSGFRESQQGDLGDCIRV